MQLLGKGLKTILIVIALLGMHVALGSSKTWKEMLDKLGTIQESLAKKCCMDNLQKELMLQKKEEIFILMMVELGLLLVEMQDGKVVVLIWLT